MLVNDKATAGCDCDDCRMRRFIAKNQLRIEEMAASAIEHGRTRPVVIAIDSEDGMGRLVAERIFGKVEVARVIQDRREDYSAVIATLHAERYDLPRWLLSLLPANKPLPDVTDKACVPVLCVACNVARPWCVRIENPSQLTANIGPLDSWTGLGGSNPQRGSL